MVAENLCSFCGDLGNLSAIMPQYSLGRTERSAVRQSWKRFCGQWTGTSTAGQECSLACERLSFDSHSPAVSVAAPSANLLPRTTRSTSPPSHPYNDAKKIHA